MGTFPWNVTTATSLVGDPVPVTALAVPPLVKTKPFVEFAVNWQVPLPEPAGETEIVHSGVPVGPATATVVSVEAKYPAVAVTRVPAPPEVGLTVKVGACTVNIDGSGKVMEFPETAS